MRKFLLFIFNYKASFSIIVKTLIKMQNEKNLMDRIGPWTTVALTLIYVFLMTLYFEYIISQEMDTVIQGIATFLALFYTWWQMKLILNQFTKLFKKND
jgi:ACR3 family arsenite efflux pump ArsB